MLIVLLLLIAAGSCRAQPAVPPSRQEVWLPYAAGETALCVQGSMSQGTHRGIHAWDFALDEGRPVVAAASGRVVRVIDDRRLTGSNDFNESNAIFIDHGGGIYSTYLHHRTGTARVRSGELVAAGAPLAEVGRVGTATPHIHFDVRGPSWHQTRDVSFRLGAADVTAVEKGRAYLSATRPDPGPGSFQDSRLVGDEFAANGVRLEGGPRAFWMTAERAFRLRGWVSPACTEVVFALWQDGQESDYVARARPDENGRFTLEICIPRSCRGPH